jgi:hypothetical protein
VLRRGRRASGVVEVVVGWWWWWCGYVVFSGPIIVVAVVVVGGGHPGEIIRGLLVWRRRSRHIPTLSSIGDIILRLLSLQNVYTMDIYRTTRLYAHIVSLSLLLYFLIICRR